MPTGFDATLCLGRHGLDTLYEVGVVERASRFKQVQYLHPQFVHRSVSGGKSDQPLSELEPLLQILRAFSLCLGMSEIGYGGQCPGVSVIVAASAKKAEASPASGSASAARLRSSS